MDTLKSDLANSLVGGLVMFTWSENLKSPAQIAHLSSGVQHHATIPLLLAIDQEGGRVARLSASNGFFSTPTAFNLGTLLNRESDTRATAATMAGWFVQTGLNINLAPVVDVNVNPASPAIGALQRSFSADPAVVSRHASWFIDEFRRKGIITTVKHFPGHGSATGDSHLGFTDVTTTWSSLELEPYTGLLASQSVDAVMTGHLFNATLDSLYPATLSHATIAGMLRGQLGYQGVVVSDEMSMKAISSHYGLDEAMVLAVKAGVDVLLYNSNLDSTGRSLARRVVDVIERAVLEGVIPAARIDQSFDRIMALKQRYMTTASAQPVVTLPREAKLSNYPNPFNASTVVGVFLPRAGNVTLGVYDVLGRQVEHLTRTDLAEGYHEFRWDAGAVSSGVYFCRLEVAYGDRPPARSAQSLKMMLLR
jgi:beta-N-acetylhexosaminidase